MKSRDEKLNQNQLKKDFKQNQKAAFIAGLPMEPNKFAALFDFLDESLEAEPCDHTLRLTTQYLQTHNLPADDVIEWLNDNGGYCDCEVLSNVEEKFEDL
jgi:hypothetical protein